VDIALAPQADPQRESVRQPLPLFRRFTGQPHGSGADMPKYRVNLFPIMRVVYVVEAKTPRQAIREAEAFLTDETWRCAAEIDYAGDPNTEAIVDRTRPLPRRSVSGAILPAGACEAAAKGTAETLKKIFLEIEAFTHRLRAWAEKPLTLPRLRPLPRCGEEGPYGAIAGL